MSRHTLCAWAWVVHSLQQSNGHRYPSFYNNGTLLCPGDDHRDRKSGPYIRRALPAPYTGSNSLPAAHAGCWITCTYSTRYLSLYHSKVLVSYHGLSKRTVAKMAGVEVKNIERMLSNPPKKVPEDIKYKVAVTVMSLRFFLKDCEQENINC